MDMSFLCLAKLLLHLGGFISSCVSLLEPGTWKPIPRSDCMPDFSALPDSRTFFIPYFIITKPHVHVLCLLASFYLFITTPVTLMKCFTQNLPPTENQR